MQKYKKYKNPMQDGRRKLDPGKHKEIKEKKLAGMTSASLAGEYGVSISLIKMIVYERRQESVRARNKEKWKDYNIHYGKEGRRIAMRKYRKKKISLGLQYNPNK